MRLSNSDMVFGGPAGLGVYFQPTFIITDCPMRLPRVNHVFISRVEQNLLVVNENFQCSRENRIGLGHFQMFMWLGGNAKTAVAVPSGQSPNSVMPGLFSSIPTLFLLPYL